jgi:hypothetical protein
VISEGNDGQGLGEVKVVCSQRSGFVYCLGELQSVVQEGLEETTAKTTDQGWFSANNLGIVSASQILQLCSPCSGPTQTLCRYPFF